MPLYTIYDLSELTGFPITTIKYYRFRGLVSPAQRHRDQPPAYQYNETHLAELRAIRDIQDNNMRIEDIRDRLHPPVEDDDE